MGQLIFQSTLGGQVNLVGPNTASTFNINVPATSGNMVTTGDTGTVTTTMLASTTGSGAVVLATSPTLVTPALGTPSALVGTNITGTAAGLSIGGNAATATTATNVSGGTSSVTSETVSGNLTLSGGTANGVTYLNGSKVVTSGSALTYSGTTLTAPTLNLTNALGTAYGGTGLTSFTANGVVYASSTSALTTGSALTFDGTYFYAGGLRLRGLDTSNTIYQSTGNLFITADAGTLALQANSSNPIAFYLNSSEQMRLTSTGLGIGTSSPAGKLQVSSNNPEVYITDNTVSAPDNAALYFGIGAVPKYGGLVTDFTNDLLNIRHNQATRATFDANGNFGVGVTPSTWVTVAAMQVKAASLGGYSSTGYLGANCYYNANWKYINTLPAARYEINAGDTGAHQWYTAPSGTAGTAITFTQAMTLDSSGNLLVGTTSTENSSKIAMTFTSANNGLALNETSNSNNTLFLFFRQSSVTIGSVSRVGTTSAVIYNTTSDYRLKNVVGAVTGSGERIDALEPVEYEWKADGLRTRGFLAHQFQEVYAGSVTGSKDAVDAEGKPVYQAMQASSSEVIADLVAEIQSFRKRLAALEAK